MRCCSKVDVSHDEMKAHFTLVNNISNKLLNCTILLSQSFDIDDMVLPSPQIAIIARVKVVHVIAMHFCSERTLFSQLEKVLNNHIFFYAKSKGYV